MAKSNIVEGRGTGAAAKGAVKLSPHLDSGNKAELREALREAGAMVALEQAASFGRWWYDPDGAQLVLSACAAAFFEVEAGLQRDLNGCLVHVVPDDVLKLLALLPRVREVPLDCEFRIVNEVSGLRWMRMQSLPGAGLPTGMLTDVTASKHAALRERFGFESTSILAGTTTVETAVTQVIRLVCETLGWEWGAFWSPDPQADNTALMCSHYWHDRHVQLAEFTRDSRTVRMGPGQGLVGQVWGSAQAAWIEDIGNNPSFLRGRSAVASGLLSGYAFPVTYAGTDGQRHHAGVLEFFSTLSRQREAQLPNLSLAVGTLVAQTVERLRQQEQTVRMARIDALTGLSNHGQFYALLDEACRQASATDRPLTVMSIGLDRFRSVNDSAGHAAGNQVLAAFAARLAALVPAAAQVGRLGGDEFAVLCERAALPAGLADAILAAARLPFDCGGRALAISASVGVSCFPENGRSAHELLRSADAAMHKSKKSGRNAVSVWSGATLHAPTLRERCEAVGTRRPAEGQEAIDEVLWTFDLPGWRINYVSPAVERVYGHARHAFYADPHLWLKCVHPADRRRVVALSASLRERGHGSFEYRIVRPDQQVRWMRYESYFAPAGAAGPERIESVGIDVTAQHELQESLKRSHRALRAIHACERVLASSRGERALLQGVCDVVAADYRMAWLGVFDASGKLALAGVAGAQPETLAALGPAFAAAREAGGGVGAATDAARPGQPAAGNAPEGGVPARREPWRQEVLRRGAQSTVALPLRQGEQSLGVLNVYADESAAFDSEEVLLLQGLADRVTATLLALRQCASLRLRERAAAAGAGPGSGAVAGAPLYAIEYVDPAFDALTGLPSRSLLQEQFGLAIAAGTPAWMLYFDLDRFKVVNDSLGYQAGDALLKQAAARLRAAVPASHLVARLGGDEFAVMVTGAHAADGIAALAQRVQGAVAQSMRIDGHEFFPTFSVGVAAWPADGEDGDSVLRHADIAMYRAKEAGRNNVQFYARAMNARSLERLQLEAELRHALKRGELLLHYQPQLDLRSGRVVGMEALVRWQHPRLGLVAPDRFIGLAEETGLIASIGAWVLRSACAQNRAWQRAGFHGLRVAVNLSAREFAQKDLAENIVAVLGETGLRAEDLELELTESLLMADVGCAVATMRELKAVGVKLSIDDFGTGYSSLSYLRRFPIDVLKVDRSFVRDIINNADDAAIVASVIALAHNLKLQVVAEGVETAAQLDYLQSLGCDVMQGHHFSAALPAAAFEQLLRSGRDLYAAAGEGAAMPG